MELVIHRDKLESSTEREKGREKEDRGKGGCGAERRGTFGGGNKVKRGEKQTKCRGENVVRVSLKFFFFKQKCGCDRMGKTPKKKTKREMLRVYFWVRFNHTEQRKSHPQESCGAEE